MRLGPLQVRNMKTQARSVARSKLTMRKPCQRRVVRQQQRQLVTGLVTGHCWTPSPLSPDEPAGWPVRSGSKCFSQAEEELLLKLHALLGNRWSLIAGRLPGRTGKEVESHWNSKLRRKLKRVGVDPDNHRSMKTLLAPADDDEPRRLRRPLDLCEAECPAKQTDRHLSFNDDVTDDCLSDAGSYRRAQQELAYGLNLELTLSTPCFYVGGKGQ